MELNAQITERGDVVELDGSYYRRKLRWYVLRLVRSAVVDAQFTGTVLIDPGNAPFLMTSLHANDTADGVALGSQEDWLVQATDNENGYLWSDGQCPRAAMFGDRILGYQPPDLSAYRAGTRIQFTIINKAAAAVAGNATISLRGWTLIPMG
jgi:hypothetical protein